MKALFRICAFSLVLLSLSAGAASPINDLLDLPVPVKPDGSPPTEDEVRTMIVEGILARRWTPVVDDAGNIRASILVRGRHFAEVEIPYSSASYSIVYASSRNLDYDEERRTIHRNYNKWVINLSASINKQFQTRAVTRAAGSAPAGPAPDPRPPRADVYDQLLKLDELRKRGALTDAEFESEKRKLLEADQ